VLFERRVNARAIETADPKEIGAGSQGGRATLCRATFAARHCRISAEGLPPLRTGLRRPGRGDRSAEATGAPWVGRQEHRERPAKGRFSFY
jgi:hypothetical protein